MSSLFVLRTLLFVAEVFSGSLVILAFAWIATAKSSASARHLNFAGAFGALLALPVFAATLPAAFHILLRAPKPLPMLLPQAADVAVTAPAPSGWSFDTSDIMLVLGAVWLAGAALIALRLVVGAVCLALLKRRSKPFALLPDDEPRVVATHRECELRLCAGDMGPVTWGIFRPVVLLPQSAILWPRERLQAVLLHELAHIRRRDSLALALAHIACALYWPNPFVWLAAAKLRREAELAADDAVILAGIKPSAYANELLELAQEFRSRAPALAGLALFMAAPSSLETRVQSVLAPTQSRSGVTSMDVLKISGAGIAAAAIFAFACPSLAQEAPSAPVIQSGTQSALPAPEAPPAPPAVATPDAPPAPPAMAAPALPPAPPAPVIPADANDWQGHVIVDGREWNSLTPEEKQRVREKIEDARRQAREALEKARPQIEKAIRDAQTSAETVRQMKPQLDAAMRELERHRAEIEKTAAETRLRQKVLDDARPAVEQAIAEVKAHQAELNKMMETLRPQLNAALAKVRADMAKEHMDVRVEESVDDALRRAQLKIDARIKDSDANDHGENRVEERDTVNSNPDNANHGNPNPSDGTQPKQ